MTVFRQNIRVLDGIRSILLTAYLPATMPKILDYSLREQYLTILAGARHQDVYSLLTEGLQLPLSGLPPDVNSAFRAHLREAAEHLAEMGISKEILNKFQQVGRFLWAREKFGGAVNGINRIELLMLESNSGASIIKEAMGGVGLALRPEDGLRYLIGAATATLWFRARMVTVAPQCLSVNQSNAAELTMVHKERFSHAAEVLDVYLSDPQRRALLPAAVGADYAKCNDLARRGAEIQALTPAFLSQIERAASAWLKKHGYQSPFVSIFAELIRMYARR